MNINELPVGSYREITPSQPVSPTGGGLNINKLPQGSYQEITPGQTQQDNTPQTPEISPESQGAVKQSDGTYRAPTFGEGLYQAALGVGKAGINTVGGINRTLASAFTPKVQNFVKTLAPHQIEMFNELYAPQTPENQAQQGGYTAEKVGEIAIPLADTAVSAIENAPKALSSVKNFIKPSLTSDEQVGKIIQGKLGDIPAAQRTLNALPSEINPAKMTPAELSDAVQNHINLNMEGTSKFYAGDTNLHPMSDFVKTTGKGATEVKVNYVQNAIDQLKAFYEKVTTPGNQQALSDLKALEIKANTEGLTSGELDQLAKDHGSTIKAFNANGEASTGLSKQAAEGTRSGVKATARDMLAKSNPQAAEEVTRLDRETSDAIKTKDLLDRQVEKGAVKIQKGGKQSGLSQAYNSKAGKTVRTIIKGGATFEGAKRIITGKF